MTTQHTLGPWESVWDADGDHVIFASRLTRRNGIVAVTAGTPDLPREEDAANAQLIAASPDLLAALEQAIPFLKRFAEHCEEQFGIVALDLGGKIVNAEAAVSKARGNQK
jgi:hypothetical protein